MTKVFTIAHAVILAALFCATAPVRALDIDGVNTVDLSHYPAENLHNEATWSSKNNAIIVIAYTDWKGAERYSRISAPRLKAGAKILAVFAAGAVPGKAFDIYYNGESLSATAWKKNLSAESFGSALDQAVDVQSLDLKIAAKDREIEDLDKKLEALERVKELAKDPDLNK